jgi:3-phenylpropionate/trans-cinnamate dioxygenase ferredoxin component
MNVAEVRTDDWLQAIAADDLEPESMRCLMLAGRRVLIAQSRGQIFAADEMCTHEEASLCLGALRKGRVKCPLHGSWFDLSDGSVDEEPATEPLRVYATRIRDGWLEICLPSSTLA